MTADSFPYAPWATTSDLPANLTPEQVGEIAPATIELGLQLSSTILFNLTRLRWPGIATLEMFPTNCRCGRPLTLAVVLPGTELDPRRYTQAGGGSCGCGSGCHRLTLERKIRAVTTVTIDGDTVDPARYEIQDGGRVLAWLPDPDDPAGRKCWPTTQDLVAAGEPGTWSVVAQVGKPVPPEATKLAGIYGWELALAMSRTSEKCRLSSKTRSASRRGQNQVQTDPMVLVENGLTSLPEVDAWISAVNGGQKDRRAAVRRPRGGRRVHTRGL